MQKTKLQIIDETVKYYSSDPRKRAVTQGLCEYLTSDGRKCAMGRCCRNPGSLLQGTSYDIFKKYGDETQKIFFPRYQGHGEEFWSELQSWHDNLGNWNDEGLTKEGINAALMLKQNWKNK